MSPDRLIYMANQIGKFFATQERADDARAVDGIATHLQKFWDPRMRQDLIGQVTNGHADGLDPLPRRAVEQLREG